MPDVTERLLALIRRCRWAAFIQLSLSLLIVWLSFDSVPQLSAMLRESKDLALERVRAGESLSVGAEREPLRWAITPVDDNTTVGELLTFNDDKLPALAKAIGRRCFETTQVLDLRTLDSKHDRERDEQIDQLPFGVKLDRLFASDLWECVESVAAGSMDIFSGRVGAILAFNTIARLAAQQDEPWIVYGGSRYQYLPRYAFEPTPTEEFAAVIDPLGPDLAAAIVLYDTRISPLISSVYQAAFDGPDEDEGWYIPAWTDDQVLLIAVTNHLDTHLAGRMPQDDGSIDKIIDLHRQSVELENKIRRVVQDYDIDEDVSVGRADQLVQQTIPVNFLQIEVPRTPAKILLPIALIAITLHMLGIVSVLQRAMDSYDDARLWSDWHWLQSDVPGVVLSFTAGAVPVAAMGLFAWQQGTWWAWVSFVALLSFQGWLLISTVLLGRAYRRKTAD